MKRTTLEVIAPSIDEAITRGAEQLGVSRDMLDVDILDEGSKGFLGIGGRQTRVRLTYREAVRQAIAERVIEQMEEDWLYFIGPGTTPRAIMEKLGLRGTPEAVLYAVRRGIVR